jgi:hypothetical protein
LVKCDSILVGEAANRTSKMNRVAVVAHFLNVNVIEGWCANG